MTNHAGQRFKERVGLPKRIADKVAERALQEGIRHSDTSGSLNRYFTYLYHRGPAHPDNIRIFQDRVYLFNGEVLITILPLPIAHRATARKIEAAKKEADSGG